MPNKGRLTPSQTVGPFFAFGLTPGPGDRIAPLVHPDLVTADAVGQPIRVEVRLLDGAGEPVRDAMVELWQADGAGRYPGPQPANNTAFTGFGRAACDGEGVARFRTVKPGPVPGPGRSMQAPHVSLGLFARGLLKRLHTRLYFPDEAANGADPVLAAVPERRRATLIARYEAGPEPLYRLDIRLRGEGETVFFAVAPGSGA